MNRPLLAAAWAALALLSTTAATPVSSTVGIAPAWVTSCTEHVSLENGVLKERIESTFQVSQPLMLVTFDIKFADGIGGIVKDHGAFAPGVVNHATFIDAEDEASVGIAMLPQCGITVTE